MAVPVVCSIRTSATYLSRHRRHVSQVIGDSDETGLAITVCHFPPGTSKWNRIEHRLFAHITMNWRGRPLTSHQVVIDLIGATTTRAGLTVQAEADTNSYPRGIKVSPAEMAAIGPQLKPHTFHGEWNYTIRP